VGMMTLMIAVPLMIVGVAMANIFVMIMMVFMIAMVFAVIMAIMAIAGMTGIIFTVSVLTFMILRTGFQTHIFAFLLP
jgi:hypothetical protein